MQIYLVIDEEKQDVIVNATNLIYDGHTVEVVIKRYIMEKPGKWDAYTTLDLAIYAPPCAMEMSGIINRL